LTELVLYNAQFDSQILIDFLDANPDMVELGLRNFRDLHPMLGALTYCRASEMVLVPDLERISIWSDSHQLDEDDGDALVAMLESRWKPDVDPADPARLHLPMPPSIFLARPSEAQLKLAWHT
jgi:hypothetical protein